MVQRDDAEEHHEQPLRRGDNAVNDEHDSNEELGDRDEKEEDGENKLAGGTEAAGKGDQLDASADDGYIATRNSRRRTQPVRETVQLKAERSSPSTRSKRRRYSRGLDRNDHRDHRRGRRATKPFAKEPSSPRNLRPRVRNRSLREVPNKEIELRRRSRDSTDDAFSPPSSDDDDSEVLAAIIPPEERFELAQGASEVKSQRRNRAPAAIPVQIAELAAEARLSRPYRPGVRDVLLDPVRTGGEAKKPQIEPMKVDPSISWDMVGGLDSHIRALKEMVLLPLLYPEVRNLLHVFRGLSRLVGAPVFVVGMYFCQIC